MHYSFVFLWIEDRQGNPIIDWRDIPPYEKDSETASQQKPLVISNPQIQQNRPTFPPFPPYDDLSKKASRHPRSVTANESRHLAIDNCCIAVDTCLQGKTFFRFYREMCSRNLPRRRYNV